MQVTFYTTSDNPKKVTKTLTAIGTIDCILNVETEIEDPVLNMLQNPAYIDQDVNYAYIPAWGRYYFVEPFSLDGKIEKLRLHTDRLMTFQAQLRTMKATVERTGEKAKGDAYLVDGEYLAKAYKDIRTYDFPNSGADSFSTVLMTVG